MRVQSANVEQRKTVFRIIVSVIETYFHEKRFMNGLVNNIKRVTQESFKKVYFRKKIVQGNHFHEMFFWMILKSVWVQRSKNRKKIIFRACFPFSTQNHFQNDQIFESFGIKYQQVTEEWQKYFTFMFQEKYFLWKVFSWKTFLSNKVISEGTEDRWYKRKNTFWRKHFFSLVFFLQNIWVVWYDSSMGVHTHDDKNEKKIRKKYIKGTFSEKRFEYYCYQWEYRAPILKKEKHFSE